MSDISVQLDDEVAARLQAQAGATGEAVSRVAERLIDEGLRMAAHPGIVFRDGPSGRRAALLRGPDVWEVIELVNGLETEGDAALIEAASWLATSPSAVRVALDYYGDFPSEIDAEIAANQRAAELFRRSLGDQELGGQELGDQEDVFRSSTME